MALFTTFITTPAVMAIYKPARSGPYSLNQRKLHRSTSASSPPSSSTSKDLRILACAHSPRDASPIINLVECIRGDCSGPVPVKLFVLHLVELTERPSSIAMVRRFRRNGLPFLGRARRPSSDVVDAAFEAYGQLGRVVVRTMNAISSLVTMHEDICGVAEDKRVSLIVLPFHKRQHCNEDGVVVVENVGPGWRLVNQRVLREAPCSVAVLVDRGFGGGGQARTVEGGRQVCVLFFGGPDDREAVELGGRMAEHPGVKVTVLRFVEGKGGGEGRADRRPKVTLRPSTSKSAEKSYTFSTAMVDPHRENERDEAALAEFRKRMEGKVRYEQRAVGNVIEAVLAIGKSREYELVVVGKGRFPTPLVAGLAGRQAEQPELGPIGDVLASSSHGIMSSVLVVQQHDVVHSDEVPVSMVIDGEATVVDVGDANHKNV